MIVPLRPRRPAPSGAFLFAALLSMGALTAAIPAQASKTGLLASAASVGTDVYSLKNNLRDNILEKGSEAVDKAIGAVSNNDREQLNEALDWADRLPGELIKDARSIFKATDIVAGKVSAVRKKLRGAVGKIDGFSRGDSVDTRAALAVSGTKQQRSKEERRIFEESELFKESPFLATSMRDKREAGARVKQWRKDFGIAPNGLPQDLYDMEKAEKERKRRGDTDTVWGEAKAQEPTTERDVWSEPDPWAAVVRESENPESKWGIVDDPEPEVVDSSDARETEPSGYAAALGQPGYKEALRAVEAREAEERRQAELAERRRQAELAERRRQAELAERRRQAELTEQRRQAKLAEQRRLARLGAERERREAAAAERHRRAVLAQQQRRNRENMQAITQTLTNVITILNNRSTTSGSGASGVDCRDYSRDTPSGRRRGHAAGCW